LASGTETVKGKGKSWRKHSKF